jgi:spore coat protein U-like protein
VNVKHIARAVAGIIAVSGSTASAAAPPQQITISADVPKSCNFDPIPAIAVGAYDWRTGISASVGGELSVTCTQGAVFSFTADRGTNSIGSQNYLASGSAKLAYSLLVAASNATTFDPAAAATTNAATMIASGRNDRFAIQITIPPAQLVPPGAYTDTVTFSLDY